MRRLLLQQLKENNPIEREREKKSSFSTVLLRLQVIAKGNIQIGSICIQHTPTARLLQHPPIALWVKKFQISGSFFHI